MENISKIMLRDHEKIVKLLSDFGECIESDKQTLKKAYEIFTWELEKHLFTEEKVIFTSYQPENYEEDYAMISELMQEHERIYQKLKAMKNSIESGETCDFTGFKEILLKHKDFEEDSVYPLLDQRLDETAKKMIISRINEIKLTDDSLRNIKIKCSECGKKLSILSGYYHSKLDKKWFFCSKCYDKIS